MFDVSTIRQTTLAQALDDLGAAKQMKDLMQTLSDLALNDSADMASRLQAYSELVSFQTNPTYQRLINIPDNGLGAFYTSTFGLVNDALKTMSVMSNDAANEATVPPDQFVNGGGSNGACNLYDFFQNALGQNNANLSINASYNGNEVGGIPAQTINDIIDGKTVTNYDPSGFASDTKETQCGDKLTDQYGRTYVVSDHDHCHFSGTTHTYTIAISGSALSFIKSGVVAATVEAKVIDGKTVYVKSDHNAAVDKVNAAFRD
jgi:hypothetical protein